MPRGRMSGWRNAHLVAAVLAVLAAGACRETVTAPGSCQALGSCSQVQLGDTVLPAAIASDTSYRGFFLVQDSPLLAISDQPSFQAIAIMRFGGRPSYWISGTDTIHLAVVDSTRFTLQMTRRDTAA